MRSKHSKQSLYKSAKMAFIAKYKNTHIMSTCVFLSHCKDDMYYILKSYTDTHTVELMVEWLEKAFKRD